MSHEPRFTKGDYKPNATVVSTPTNRYGTGTYNEDDITFHTYTYEVTFTVEVGALASTKPGLSLSQRAKVPFGGRFAEDDIRQDLRESLPEWLTPSGTVSLNLVGLRVQR